MHDGYSECLYSPFADIIDYENAIIAWSEPYKKLNYLERMLKQNLKKELKTDYPWQESIMIF